MTRTKGRAGGVDFLKFAFSVMIALHHFNLNYNDGVGLPFESGYILVEFFFMVSGYLLAAKAARNREENVWTANLQMLKGKVLHIFPYIALAVLTSCLVNELGAYTAASMSRRVLYALPDIFGLQMLGAPMFAATGVAWYISAMFAVSFLIYPILCRKRELFSRYIGPASAVLILGWLDYMTASLNDPGEWMQFAYKGLLRGYADMALGCAAYEIKLYVDRNKGLSRLYTGALELGGFALIAAYATLHGTSDYWDYYVVPPLMISIGIAFSERSLTGRIFRGRVFNALGIFSLSIYLNHFYVKQNLWRFLPEMDRGTLMWIYLGIVLALALMNYFLGRLLGKVICSGRRMLAATAILACAALLLPVTEPVTSGIDLLLLKGNGSREAPYEIGSRLDLQRLRDAVNQGRSLEGKYVLQTADIDMRDIEWTPIGVFDSNRYFAGVYDGGGHTLKNLRCTGRSLKATPNTGLFGKLEGEVRNLGIESGYLSGDCVGAIASHSVGEGARIINCYSRAKVKGTTRAGGICDNFVGGELINCVGSKAAQTSPVLGYDASRVMAIYPADSLPATFTGEYTAVEMVGEDPRERLNDGLQKLIDMGALDASEAAFWSEG